MNCESRVFGSWLFGTDCKDVVPFTPFVICNCSCESLKSLTSLTDSGCSGPSGLWATTEVKICKAEAYCWSYEGVPEAPLGACSSFFLELIRSTLLCTSTDWADGEFLTTPDILDVSGSGLFSWLSSTDTMLAFCTSKLPIEFALEALGRRPSPTRGAAVLIEPSS